MRAEDRRRPAEALDGRSRYVVGKDGALIHAGVTHQELKLVEPRLQPVTQIRMRNSVKEKTRHRIPSLAVLVTAAARIRNCTCESGHLTVGLPVLASGAERSDTISVAHVPGIVPERVQPLAIVG